MTVKEAVDALEVCERCGCVSECVAAGTHRLAAIPPANLGDLVRHQSYGPIWLCRRCGGKGVPYVEQEG